MNVSRLGMFVTVGNIAQERQENVMSLLCVELRGQYWGFALRSRKRHSLTGNTRVAPHSTSYNHSLLTQRLGAQILSEEGVRTRAIVPTRTCDRRQVVRQDPCCQRAKEATLNFDWVLENRKTLSSQYYACDKHRTHS